MRYIFSYTFLVRIAARAQNRPAPRRATTGARGHSLRQSAELKEPATKAQAETTVTTGMEVKTEERQTVLVAPESDVVAAPGPAPLPEAVAATPGVAPMSSHELHTRITDALDAEDLPQVRSLCKEAMETNPSIAKFCRRWWFMFK